jgi:hypothetical protein
MTIEMNDGEYTIGEDGELMVILPEVLCRNHFSPHLVVALVDLARSILIGDDCILSVVIYDNQCKHLITYRRQPDGQLVGITEKRCF